MAYDTGYSRRSTSERDMQSVAIISVDPVTRTAIGVTRTRHSITINCSFATGDTITSPATGEQWYCERFDNEWRLYGRIPFNDPTLNIKPEEGQVSVGSARGPLELEAADDGVLARGLAEPPGERRLRGLGVVVRLDADSSVRFRSLGPDAARPAGPAAPQATPAEPAASEEPSAPTEQP